MWKCCMHWFGNLRWSHSAYSSLCRCLSMRMVHCLRLLCDVRQACTYMSNAVATCLQRQTNVTIIPPTPPTPNRSPPYLFVCAHDALRVCYLYKVMMLMKWWLARVPWQQKKQMLQNTHFAQRNVSRGPTTIPCHPFSKWTSKRIRTYYTVYGSTYFTADFCPASNWTLCEWFTLISNSMKSDNTSC